MQTKHTAENTESSAVKVARKVKKSEIRKMMAKEVMSDCELRKEVGGANFLIKIILLLLYKLDTMY